MTRSSRKTAAANPSMDAGPSWHELAQSRRERRGRFGLATRLAVYFALLTLGAVGTTAWMLAQRNDAATTAGLTGLARSSGTSLGIAAREAIANRDVAKLQTLATEAMATAGRDAQLESIAFQDAKGATLAGIVDQSTPTPIAPTNKLLAILNPTSTATVIVPVYAASVAGREPIVVGQVEMRVSTSLIERARIATYQAFGLVGIGVVFGALLIATLYVRQAFRPLNELAAAARRVTSGDLNTVMPVRGGDSAVFKLAVAFNELVAWVRGQRDELARSNATMAASIQALQEKVESRSAQLEAANERLHGEIAEKEDFLRAVSHDLNAPLRNIGGMVAMLMMKDKATLSPEVVGRLERIKKNVDIETDLINELLELSRIKTRRQNLEVVDTESIVWDLRGLFENDLKTRNIEIVLETSLPTLYAERARVRQVFLNLIDNAIKYMGDDKPRREIHVGCRVNVTEAEFYVRDSGLGIHPEDLDKVFFVFRRGRGDVAQKVPGKGVGLASVKSIIETYAGRIWVQSTLGEGTTFLFTINGKYVPSVAGQLPSEMNANDAARALPTLAAADSTDVTLAASRAA